MLELDINKILEYLMTLDVKLKSQYSNLTRSADENVAHFNLETKMAKNKSLQKEIIALQEAVKQYSELACHIKQHYELIDKLSKEINYSSDAKVHNFVVTIDIPDRTKISSAQGIPIDTDYGEPLSLGLDPDGYTIISLNDKTICDICVEANTVRFFIPTPSEYARKLSLNMLYRILDKNNLPEIFVKCDNQEVKKLFELDVKEKGLQLVGTIQSIIS
jgi:hypothetical protein